MLQTSVSRPHPLPHSHPISTHQTITTETSAAPAASPQQDKKPKTSSPDTIEAGAKVPDTNS